MNETITNIAGWIPAVILPIASTCQLVTIVKNRSTEGVSAFAWLLFGIANLGLYIFTEKYFALQSLIGLLGTATLNFIIVAAVLRLRKSAKK